MLEEPNKGMESGVVEQAENGYRIGEEIMADNKQ